MTTPQIPTEPDWRRYAAQLEERLADLFILTERQQATIAQLDAAIAELTKDVTNDEPAEPAGP